jgi:hypothetical protein
MEYSASSEATGPQLVQQISLFDETWRFITTFTRANT